MKKIAEIWERYYPFIIAIVFVGVAKVTNPDLCIIDDVDSILNSTISFVSIIIGFLGALVALIFSTDNKIMKTVIKDGYYSTRMKKFFLRPIQSGFMWVFLSIIFSFRATLQNIFSTNKMDTDSMLRILKLIWLYLSIYFLVSSYRAISIILKITFTGSNTKDDVSKTTSEDELITDEEYEKIKEKKSV